MDKLAIVIDNYIDAECDANTTPRQAYERGFRRAYKKCETVMHSRKIEKEKASTENDRLKAENAKLRELVRDMRKALFTLNIDHCQACPRDTINGPCTKYLVGGSDECSFEEDMRELEIDVDE